MEQLRDLLNRMTTGGFTAVGRFGGIPGSVAVLRTVVWVAALFGFARVLVPGQWDGADLEDLRDGFEERRDAGFEVWRGKPLEMAPKREPLSAGRPIYTRHFSYSIIDFAMAAFWNGEQLEEANEALKKKARLYIDDRDLRNDRDSFYWAADVLCRIVEFFGREGSIAPGRLSGEAEDELLEMMWLYAKEHSYIGEVRWFTDPPPAISQPISAEWKESGTWHVGESENHHVMKFSTLWHFSRFLDRNSDYGNREYNDGHTAGEHHRAWTAYAKEYIRERGRKGLFIEMANGGYGAHTLKGIYNFYDFAGDPRLRELAGKLIDLYYASWAQEQIDGVRGGGQSRVGNFRSGMNAVRHIMWFYLEIGDRQEIVRERATVATSDYRMPLVVMDLARSIEDRGEYEVRERRPGLALDGYFGNPDYRLRRDFGGILRYSYVTPDFIMGMPLVEARPFEEWTLISSQNRRHGVIFRGHVHARLAPICDAEGATFNEQWGVQRKGTMIVQKLPEGYSRGAGDLQVWFSGPGLRDSVARGDWVFVEAEGAYAAVRPARGGHGWKDPESGPPGVWMTLDDGRSPVIIEVARKTDFENFEAFQEQVGQRAPQWRQDVLVFTGLNGDTFTFYADRSALPEINGEPIDLAPEQAFDSPFVRSDWNSGIVTIRKGDRERRLDFN